MQLLNIETIDFTEDISKLDKFKDINDKQLVNKLSIIFIEVVLKFNNSRYAKDLQPENIASILVREGV